MIKTEFLFSLAAFYSRIVLKKIPSNSLTKFRSVERNLKKFMKIKSDITYLIINY